MAYAHCIGSEHEHIRRRRRRRKEGRKEGRKERKNNNKKNWGRPL